jgi:hypothetical protein
MQPGQNFSIAYKASKSQPIFEKQSLEKNLFESQILHFHTSIAYHI